MSIIELAWAFFIPLVNFFLRVSGYTTGIYPRFDVDYEFVIAKS